MPKFNVMIGLPTGDGSSRTEVGNFRCEAVRTAHSDPEVKDVIGELLEAPIQRFPTNIARNVLVDVARQHKVDFLFMVDSDSWPVEGWFKAAFKFLMSQPVPSVIAAPYTSGGPNEEVMVFEFTRTQTGTPLTSPPNAFALTRINRDDAARRKGVERVCSVGTHCIAIDMRVFDLIDKVAPKGCGKPYFFYQFNPEQTAVTETEDCAFARQAFNVGVPIFVDWSFWTPHWKGRWTARPMALPITTVPDFYRSQCAAELLHTPEGRAALLKAAEEAKASAETKPVGADAVPVPHEHKVNTLVDNQVQANVARWGGTGPPEVYPHGRPAVPHQPIAEPPAIPGTSPAFDRWLKNVEAKPNGDTVEKALATE